MISTLIQVTNLSGSTIYLDLYDDVSINLNLSFAEIQDITSRNSGYSQTFRVPGTPINNEFFNYMFNVNQDGLSFDIQKSVKCSVNYKGITVLDGVLRLLKIFVTDNKVDYEVNIQDEVGIFINDISNKLLVDLDFSDLNHTYDATNIKLSWGASYTGATPTGGLKDGAILYPFSHIGYIYDAVGNVITTGSNASPLLELQGSVGSISNNTTPMRTTGFKPSIQIYQVLKRIFNQNGYNIESDFFATEYFQRLYMPLLFNSDTYFISTSGATTGNSTVGLLQDAQPQIFNFTGSTCQRMQGLTPWTYLINNLGPTFPPYGWAVDPSPFTTDARFYAWAGGQYTFTYSLDLYVPEYARDANTFIRGDVYYYKNRTTKYFVNTFTTVDTPFNPYDVTVDDITGTTITLTTGDFIELIIEIDYTPSVGGCGDARNYVVPTIESTSSNMNLIDAPNLIVGSTIDVNAQFIDEYKQFDFLKGLITQFNLMFVKHPFLSDTYVMEPYEDYVGKGILLDWTDKLDKSKSIEISPITNMIGKAIDYRYIDDGDTINSFTKSINNNRNFGTMNFIPSGVTINDKPIELVSFFAPTPCDILTYGNTPNPFIVPQFYGTKDISVSGVTLTQLLPMRLKPRILHYYGMKATSISWYFFDEVTSAVEAYATFPLVSHQSTIPSSTLEQAIDLNFGNSASPQDPYAPTQTQFTAFNLYYKNYIDSLLSSEARMVTANFYLTIDDIMNLEFKDIIFFKDAYYRINKIADFNLINNKTTKVELVKLTNLNITGIEPPPPICESLLKAQSDELIQTELEQFIDIQQCLEPTPEPTPTNTPTPTITPTSVTPTPTPTSVTPTPTPTITPTSVTPTPTPTPTVTPGFACPGDCYSFTVNVTQVDLNSATGNIREDWNNAVWVTYNDCETREETEQGYFQAEEYYRDLCVNTTYGEPSLYIYVNNIAQPVFSSTIENTYICCLNTEDCVNYSIQNNTGIEIFYHYLTCGSAVYTQGSLLNGQNLNTPCVIRDSLVTTSNPIITITTIC
jgi:cell division septation protein DedD